MRKAKTLGTALTRGKPVRAFDAVASVADAGMGSLQNVVAGLGTDRDKMSYTGYVMPYSMSEAQLAAIYRGSWLARKTVDIPAEDMTREWRTVKFDAPTRTGGKPKARKRDTRMFDIEKAEKKLNVRAKFEEALRWGRLYGGAALIMGTKEMLDTPLVPDNVKKDDLQYLLVVDRHRMGGTGLLVKDPADPHFGTPEFYILAESSLRVHHSRIIRFGGNPVPWQVWINNDRWDDSVLQTPYDAMRNADTTSAAVATMMFEANVDVIKAEELGNILAKKNGEAILTKRFQTSQLLKSFNRTLLLDATETYEKKSNNFANLDAILTKFMQNYCGAVDIPMTRFYGQSATGLNATGDNDIRNYYDSVSAKQNLQLRPQLDAFDEVFIRSVLGAMPDDFRYEFNSLWQMSDKETADIQKVNADRDKIYIDAGVILEGTVAKDLKENGVYKNLTDEDVEMVDDLSREAFQEPEPAIDPATGLPVPPAGPPAAPGAPGVPTPKAPEPDAPPPVKAGA